MSDKKKKEVLEIEGFIDNPLYEKIACICSQNPNNILERYPFVDCINCKCKKSLSTVPRKPFDWIQDIHGKKGKTTTKRITKIRIALRDEKTDEILGYEVIG